VTRLLGENRGLQPRNTGSESIEVSGLGMGSLEIGLGGLRHRTESRNTKRLDFLWRVASFHGCPTHRPAGKATQGQMDGFFSQLPYKCHLKEMVSVGD
jgi:hypothetical protein